MIPDTKNGLPAMACVSAMQKAIRRGMEREAMEFAVELHAHLEGVPQHGLQAAWRSSAMRTSTPAAATIVPFVKACVEQAQRWYDPVKIGEPAAWPSATPSV